MQINKAGRRTHRLVTQGDWGVSCTTGSGINGAILHVYRSRIAGRDLPVNKWLRGIGDGRLFPSTESADQWAFDHGYTQLYFTSADLRARRLESASRRNLSNSELREVLSCK